MEKCAVVLITGDRVDYIDYAIKSCLSMVNTYNKNILVDIYLISYENLNIKSEYKISNLQYINPSNNTELIESFPKSVQQLQNFSNDKTLSNRISLGHLILCGLVPDVIYKNLDLFKKYDYILKSRADLIFDFNENDIKNINFDKNILTFECFWGGCRYNPNFTNDHLVFGKSEDIIKIIAYSINNCLLNNFWNPEQYMTYLFSLINKNKIQISTDKYYLLSKDRDSRKWIGFPLEKINNSDINFLQNLGINTDEIKFTNEKNTN